jgi:hypothetical protein
MLHDFLDTHRAELIARCRAKVARRPTPPAVPREAEHGIPRFLEQLIRALRQEQVAATLRSRMDGGAGVVRAPTTDTSEIGVTAMQHGLDLAQQGLTIDQVVHDYGDLCQAVTELAGEMAVTIEVGEFRTLNRCLDDAIAGAVTEFCYQRDTVLTGQNIRVADERARTLLRELQGHVQTATLAMAAVKSGNVGLKGATGTILGLSLVALRTLIERSLADAQGAGGLLARH